MGHAERAEFLAMEPLFSPRWHRVATLCPRLRPHVQLRHQSQRGTDWFLLVDTSADEVRRLNRAAYEWVGRCDGRTSVGQIWEALLQAAPDEAMTQDEVLRLLAMLHERQLLAFDRAPDVEAVFDQRERLRSKRRWQGVNPLAFRMPLMDPSPWLRRLQGLGRRVFSLPGLIAWLLVVLAVAVAAVPQLGTIWSEGRRLLASPGDLALAWLLYPVIKLVHETAHGLAMQRWGVLPRRAGITLLMLTPVPFVDASAADAMRHPHQRAVVSAAGILAELLLAALALALWLVVQPGLLRDLALSTVLIGTVSTLLVNGNPLLRFDGYYVLCDVLDLRNLATRSGQAWRQALRRVLLADATAHPLLPVPGERPWLLAYAPLSLLYRAWLAVTVALWVAGFSTPLGVLVALAMLGNLVLRPLWAGWLAVWARPGLSAWSRLLPLAAVAALVLLAPLPHHRVVLAVVAPPEQSQIRAGTAGFLVQWQAQDGQPVQAGDPVAQLEDDELAALRGRLNADRVEADVQLFGALATAPDEAAALRERLAFNQAELARVDERLAALQVRAPVTGVLVLPRQIDQAGRLQAQGALLGHVLNDAPLLLRVAVPHGEADLFDAAARTAQVRLASEPGAVRTGELPRGRGAAIHRLPSAALGEPAGGDIPIDPSDAEGLTPRGPVVVLDVRVPGLGGEHIGERAWVRVDLGHQSLGSRLARQVRQLLLGHLNPAA